MARNFDGSMAKHGVPTKQDRRAWWEGDISDLVTLTSRTMRNRTIVPSRCAATQKLSSGLAPSWHGPAIGPSKGEGRRLAVKSISLSIARSHLTRDARKQTRHKMSAIKGDEKLGMKPHGDEASKDIGEARAVDTKRQKKLRVARAVDVKCK